MSYYKFIAFLYHIALLRVNFNGFNLIDNKLKMLTYYLIFNMFYIFFESLKEIYDISNILIFSFLIFYKNKFNSSQYTITYISIISLLLALYPFNDKISLLILLFSHTIKLVADNTIIRTNYFTEQYHYKFYRTIYIQTIFSIFTIFLIMILDNISVFGNDLTLLIFSICYSHLTTSLIQYYQVKHNINNCKLYSICYNMHNYLLPMISIIIA